MDKRKVTKYAAEMIAVSVVKNALTKAVNTAIPSSEDHETMTHLATGIGAYALVDQFDTQIHAFIDACFDKYAARKAEKTPTPEN